jgi:DNA adenine methylase
MPFEGLGGHPPETSETIATPFLKWAGGKSVIADRIISKLGAIPAGSTYFEPFLGGGAVFFRVRPQKATLIDSNKALIRTYAVVKENVEELLEELRSLPPPESREQFEAGRTEFNDLLPVATGSLRGSDFRMAALFIWLNHTCYNGLFRVNREGKFNVPWGQYERAFIYDEDNLRICSQTLVRAHADLRGDDYRLVLAQAVAGDVVYFDPPYHPLDETSNFTGYTVEGFGTDDQAQLSKDVFRLIERGCRVVVSNSQTPEIRHFYRGLQRQEVLVPRAINSDPAGRSRVAELLIYSRSRMTLHDQWERVVDECNFDLDGRSTFEVTSRRVKNITGEEPRLIAKMDTREDLPRTLAHERYFILPVSGSRYALVPGDGFHDLENIDGTYSSFDAQREVPVTVALQAGESAAIQTALYTGLLESVIGVPRLRPTLHNDRVTLKDVTIKYGNAWKLPINGARVEVDAGFENHDEFFIFECKKWRKSELTSFNIRQLFFPQLRALKELRAVGLDWNIRCFFLNLEPDTSIYRFWEYEFRDPYDYASINLRRTTAYQLVQPQSRSPAKLLHQLLSGEAVHTNYVPQANDASKVLTLVQGVAEGFATTAEIATRFRFDPRQSSYYGEAAEALGLIERPRGRRFTLTSLGAAIAHSPTDQATKSVIEQIFTLPVFRAVAEAALAARTSVLYPEEITPFVRRAGKDRYNETTIRRRSQSVAAWINWIGEATGTIRVNSHPRLSPTTKTLDEF